MNFKELTKLEPRLEMLYQDILKAPRLSYWKANSEWYQTYKPRMFDLVGMGAEQNNRVIRSSQAYDMAYKTLYDALVLTPTVTSKLPAGGHNDRSDNN
jgi:hypothetical protein